MSDRKTIYFPDGFSEQYLADAEHGLSSRIQAIIRRYDMIVTQSRPLMTRNEWCAICDANNGVDDLLMGEHPDSARQMIWANVADAAQQNDLANKWDIDAEALVHRLRHLNVAEAFAVYEAVRAFWQHADKDTDAALQAAGMLPSDQVHE